MMTPQELAEHTFTKGRLGGYHAAEVDQFLETVITDYTTLYKDSAVLKSKLKVLANKLAEYRETEEAMRSVIASARRTADGIIAEAEQRREALLAEADAEVAEYRQELRTQIADAEAQLSAAREATGTFVSSVQLLLGRQTELLAQLGSIKGVAPADPAAPHDEVSRTAAEIDDSIRRMLSDEELAALNAADAEAAAAPAEAPAAQEEDPTVRMSFTVQCDNN